MDKNIVTNTKNEEIGTQIEKCCGIKCDKIDVVDRFW
jgi:hypothetical protein